MPSLPAAIKTRLMVGMEIHVELATRSKMWTSAPNVAHRKYFDAQPNTLLDPVVVGMPGVLPVMNRQAVEMAMRVGRALGCQIARHTKWDRKSYYYPDLPKNYQISQYDLPLCGEGVLEIPASDEPDAPMKTVRILRAHLEEDAGKLLHEAPGGLPIDHSIVDLNRAGTPLLEIVTYPDLETPEQCVIFGQALRNICRHLGVTEGIMQRGHMRFEPNINVIIEKNGQTYKTPIVEIKNLNSFKAVQGAVAYEYQRQVDDWLDTGRVMGERAKSTRGWDDARGITTHQRHKEDADEYRYFPDPDLVDLKVDDAWLKRIDDSIPQLPLAKQRKYVQEYGLSPVNARTLVDEPQVTAFFESVIAAGVEPKRAAALLLNYGAKYANARGCRIDELGITSHQIKEMADLIDAGKLSSNAVDTLFGFCMHHPDKSINELASFYSLIQVSDADELETYVMGVLVDPRNKKIIEDIRNGKDKAIGALVGQVMKSSFGQTNPTLVANIIKQKLRG
jgi:aspartyl-tRNA(Asn)/glutamyl-tRNA(Gln) amidotransferase subunit B